MTPPKPHRVIFDRVSGYADEAAAFMRRRRVSRKPFARVYYSGGAAASHPSSTETGRELFLAAARVIDAGGS